MYTVLIQNQKTIESFQEFHPLFIEAFNRGDIGCCRWVESGTTVETALPGLSELIADKEEWRAIVVRVEDESSMREFATSSHNPYDFKVNKKHKDIISESPVPLIRLTHMLGDVPAPEEEYIPDVRIREHKAPEPYFRRDDSEEAKNKRAKNQQVYDELIRKYEYDGKKPVNILVVTLYGAVKKSARKIAEATWDTQLEIQSSDFWKRNDYPGVCRFLVYQYVREGHVQKEADMFNFWMCVMLLATNDIDPSTLQAYRLYNISTEFDKAKMTENFQNKIDELAGCKLYVDDEIKRELQRRMDEKNPMPIYKMDIPVAMEIPGHMEVSVDIGEFDMCPRSINNELNKWEGLRTGAEETVNSVYRQADRALAESAERMRYCGSMSEEEVTPLDRFQKEDMNNELSKMFDKILQTQNALSESTNGTKEKTEQLATEVREKLKVRLDKALAIEIGLAVMLLVIAACVPAFLFCYKYYAGTVWGVLAFTLFLVMVFVVVELVILYKSRKDLTKKIDEYNDAMEDNVSALTQDLKQFSNFVSNIVSYSRGRSFLKLLKHKKFRMEADYESLQKHMRAINLMAEKVEKWSVAHYLSINYNREPGRDFTVDIYVNPRKNVLYTFENDKEYYVPLNETGDYITAPFNFVEKLYIEREELFEDARSYE